MALAQVQSLVEADQAHPPISIAPPNETVVVHVQPDVVNPICYQMLTLFVWLLGGRNRWWETHSISSGQRMGKGQGNWLRGLLLMFPCTRHSNWHNHGSQAGED